MSAAAPTGGRTFFFAYARTDSDFVLKLASDLRAAGVRLWLDQLDVRGGQHWDHAVEGALKDCEGMIVVLSPESLGSHNVMDEVSYALDERKLVVPVLLRRGEMPYRLRRVQYVDFTGNHDAGLAQLLRATAAPHAVSSPRARRRYVYLARLIGATLGALGAIVLWKIAVRDMTEGFRAAIDEVGGGIRANAVLLGGLTGAVCGKDGKRWRAAAIGAMAGALFAPVSQLPEATEGWSVSAVAYAMSCALAGAIAAGRRWAVLGAIGLFALAHVSERFHWSSLALVSVASAAPLGAIVGLALSLWRDAQRKKGGA